MTDITNISEGKVIKQNRKLKEDLKRIKPYLRLELYYQGLISEGFVKYLEDLESENTPLMFFSLDRSVDCVLNEHYNLSGDILSFIDKTS